MKKRILMIGFLFFSATAWAHSLNVIARFDGHEISGKSYYSDETPAAGYYVEAYQLGMHGSETTPVATGKTNDEGFFVLSVVGNGPFKVVVEGIEGHRAEQITSNVAFQNVGRAELEMLREDIQLLKDKLHLSDIIGGVGYILGLFGIAALFQSHRKGS